MGRSVFQLENCLLISYPLPFGKHYLYAPYGPVVSEVTPDWLKNFKSEVSRVGREEKAIFVRLDFIPRVETKTLAHYFTPASPHTYHGAYFQPRQEWLMTLDNEPKKLFQGFPKKTRYSIKTSQNRGVNTEIITGDFKKYFESFDSLMSETASRDSFSLHPRKYYEIIFDSLPTINAYLVVAKHQAEILAINLIIIHDGVANYVFGASSSEERQRLPAYAAQWAGMQEAIRRGATHYNFGGVGEHWGGVSAFKQQFPGQVWQHSDLVDLVISPFWYHLYNLRKRLQNR